MSLFSFLALGEPPKVFTVSQSEIRLVFKYEHTDWGKGFAVRVVTIGEGPAEVILSTEPTLDASKVRQKNTSQNTRTHSSSYSLAPFIHWCSVY